MERMWTSEAAMKYPKQWLVMVNLSWGEKNMVFGDVYLVTPDVDEAYRKAKELKTLKSMGEVVVREGFNDAPQIGGLEWSR